MLDEPEATRSFVGVSDFASFLVLLSGHSVARYAALILDKLSVNCMENRRDPLRETEKERGFYCTSGYIREGIGKGKKGGITGYA